MSEIQTNIDEKVESTLSIHDLLYLFRQKWYWFVISLAFFFCVGVVYLMKTAPMYTRTAALLIKDDKKGTSVAAEMSSLGIFQPKSNIDNEMLTLQSPSLMEEVITRLKLNDSYSIKTGLRKTDLYKSTPFIIAAAEKDMPEFTCVAVLAEEGNELTLSDFRYEEEEPEDVVKGQLGDTVVTPVGKLYLSVSPWDSEGLRGKQIMFGHVEPSSISQDYAKGVVTELGAENGTIIDISYSASSIQKAEDILNTLIQVYNDRWVLDKNQMAVSTSRFISDRLGVIEGELGNVDSDISSFKSAHLMPNVEVASELYMRQNEETRREISDVNNQLQVARHIRNELSNDRIDQQLPTPSALQSPDLNQQIGAYNTMVIDRNRLIAGSSETNPLVQERTSALRVMRDNIISTVDNLISALNSRVNSLHGQQVATTGQLAANPNQAKYLLSVERQQKVKEQLYLYLLQKREENELNQAFTSYNTRLITPPMGSKLPTSPNRRNVMLVMFLLGLVVPAGALYLYELLDNKVRSRRDLEGLSVPYVGEIPMAFPMPHGLKRLRPAKKSGSDDRLLIEDGNTDIINEAFRVVRSNLEFVGGRAFEESRTIMVTSAVPGSGKTFVTMNLAAVMALKGKRVIVLDLDMRRASLSKYVGSPHVGISAVLIGKAPLSAAIVKNVSGIDNLSVLPVGALPPNPAELLYTPEFSKLMEELKSSYDCVLLDCPPAEVVADAKIISRFVDLTIWVVRAGLFEKPMLPLLQRYYDERRYPSLCILLNGTDPAHTSSYQRYGYAATYKQYAQANHKQ
ncbi:MAG: polysaccharide biosynthesis tyrosine autokinase [Muribaculaceae bacterium]|nr:polysaccharide biosynthesis tyrosine autokinase [Muribaculaceae bacterium]